MLPRVRQVTCSTMLLALLFATPAQSWESDKENDIELDCKIHDTANIDRLIVRVFTDDGSAGKPRLVALGKNDRPLWERPFPHIDEINVAKAYTKCSTPKRGNGLLIELWDSNPGDPNFILYRYGFDWKALTFLSKRIVR